jgi:hypothetical protein
MAREARCAWAGLAEVTAVAAGGVTGAGCGVENATPVLAPPAAMVFDVALAPRLLRGAMEASLRAAPVADEYFVAEGAAGGGFWADACVGAATVRCVAAGVDSQPAMMLVAAATDSAANAARV